MRAEAAGLDQPARRQPGFVDDRRRRQREAGRAGHLVDDRRRSGSWRCRCATCSPSLQVEPLGDLAADRDLGARRAPAARAQVRLRRPAASWHRPRTARPAGFGRRARPASPGWSRSSTTGPARRSRRALRRWPRAGRPTASGRRRAAARPLAAMALSTDEARLVTEASPAMATARHSHSRPRPDRPPLRSRSARRSGKLHAVEAPVGHMDDAAGPRGDRRIMGDDQQAGARPGRRARTAGR